jgi:hypothetical protein
MVLGVLRASEVKWIVVEAGRLTGIRRRGIEFLEGDG